KIGFAEFLIDQAIDLGMKTEEVKNNAQLMNLMQNFYPYFYIKGIKSYWAQEMLKEVNKGKSEEEVLNFFAQFFPVLKKVEEILQDFPEELTLTQAGRESLLNKILKEKREEKGRELTPEEIALFSGEDYLKAQFKNGVVSFWTREMLNKGLTEEQLRETFRGRRSALPLLSTYLGKAADNTDPFVNGLLSLVAEGLREGEFNIVQAIDKEFISALIGEEREKILSLMYEIARLSSFSDFLGIKKIAGTDKEVELQIEELSTNQKGFLMYLTNLAWRLAKKLSKQDALQEIADRLSTLKEFLMLYGWTKPEEIEKLISDSRLMGRLSFFVDAVAPLSRLEIEKQASSRLFTDFLTRYNNGKPIPEDLKSSLGEKVNWTNEMWQVFKGHLEKFLGRKLLSSQAKVKTLPKSTISESTPVGQFVKMVRSQLGDEEVLRINKFVRDVLGESILENEGDFVYQHHLDKELLHRWAVILETFIGKSKDVKELEENWKRLITKFVEISRKFEPYMSEYLREDYDIGNSEHTGLVGWLTERVFNKALKWLYEAKYRDLNPEPNWLNPSWLLNKETELVEKEIKFAIELRPYVEAAHLMRIDPFNPAYSGVWWFYVDGFMAKERPYAVYPAGFFVSEKALKQHLKNQATLFVDLLTKPSASMNGAAAIQFMVYAGRIEQIESYFKKYNGLDTEFIGVLSYFAQEHIFNKIQGSGDCGPVSDFTGAINCNAGLSFDGPLPDAKPLQRGKPSALAILMPYVSELLYGDAERLRMRQTDSDKEGIENENLVKSLLNLIDEWNGRKNGKVNRRQAWDWSAFYGWEKLDKDGKPTGIITNGIPAGNEVTADAPEGRYGYILNQTLLAQIQVTLKIAQQIKEKVAELLGVERLDFNNPEHWKFLIKKAHEVYISARNTALDWENEGRIPTLRYWTPDLALLEDDLSSVTNPIFEKVNYKRTIFNQLPLRSAHLKTGEWLLPQFKDEWRIQALILPYLKEKDKELKLDALLTHSLLKNYFLISKDLGKEIVLDKIKEEEILERGLSIFKEKNSIDILP
ncbi:MAG: hypothetical protein NC821_05550, partial [Candidatus Omnitrophica bacterium]|nr:hypothetical protein [Candidatus Omnitrophota bacterium]